MGAFLKRITPPPPPKRVPPLPSRTPLPAPAYTAAGILHSIVASSDGCTVRTSATTPVCARVQGTVCSGVWSDISPAADFAGLK